MNKVKIGLDTGCRYLVCFRLPYQNSPFKDAVTPSPSVSARHTPGIITNPVEFLRDFFYFSSKVLTLIFHIYHISVTPPDYCSHNLGTSHPPLLNLNLKKTTHVVVSLFLKTST